MNQLRRAFESAVEQLLRATSDDGKRNDARVTACLLVGDKHTATKGFGIRL